MTSPRRRMRPHNPLLHDADREHGHDLHPRVHEDLGIRAALREARTAAT